MQSENEAPGQRECCYKSCKDGGCVSDGRQELEIVKGRGILKGACVAGIQFGVVACERKMLEEER